MITYDMTVNIDTEAVKSELYASCDDAAQAVKALVQSRAPVRTGRLRDSVDCVNTEGNLDLSIGVPYAVYTEIRTGWLSEALGDIGDVVIEKVGID